MTIPTKEQFEMASKALSHILSNSDEDGYGNEHLAACAAVAAYLKSPPKADRVDEIVSLLKKYAPSSLSLVAHHAWTNGSDESWSITGGALRGISYNSPDAIIAAIHTHFNAPMLVDMQPVVADEPSDYEGLDTALVRAEMAVAPTLDLATAPLVEGNWVDVVGPSITGAVDRPIGPWKVRGITVLGRFYMEDDNEWTGVFYERSSLRGPVQAPTTPMEK